MTKLEELRLPTQQTMIKLQDILNYFKSKTNKVNLIRIDEVEIKNSLPKIDYSVLNPTRYYLLDGKYHSCTLKEFKEILSKDFTNWKLYNKNDYDCDNFAFKLYSNLKTKYPTLSVGIVFSLSHAFNVFIDNKGIAHYIEPQNDKIYSYSKLTKQYKPFDLVII